MWQQIETAPKNRTVLIFYKNECDKDRTIKAKYVGKHTVEHCGDDALDFDEDEFGNIWWPEGWYEEIDNWDDYASAFVNHSPTHWMPLPKAPQD